MNRKKLNRILHVFLATRLKVFLACVAMLVFWQETFSQTFPVQVQTNTKPPYYNYLNYYSDFNNNLTFVATLLDFNAPPVSVRLRLKISGPGYSYRTRTDIPVGNVFVLNPGVPTFIQGSDLLPYFNPNNLVVEQGSVNWNNMPEGLTTFCVEVIKVGVNNEVLSAESCSSFFLQLMQPPQPFLPLCNSTVDTAQMFHTFTWSPPLNYTPAFGAELNYNFSLYEWLDTTNYNIFQTGQGLVFTAQTQVPLVQVSNFDVLFQSGRKYVWRVQAQLSQNGIPIQMITQNGLSVPCSFNYGQAQSLAGQLASGLQINLSAQGQTERKGVASWTVVNTSGNGLSGFDSYILEYRKKPTGQEGFEFYWFVDTVYNFNKAIYQLEPSTTYECRLRGRYGDYTSDYTPVVEFTTAPPYEYTCGDQNMPWMSSQYTPLATAEPGMVFQIGQFSMTVTAIHSNNGNGYFTGSGRIAVDFLAGAQAKVSFVNILVDQEFNVREGIVQVNSSGVDAWLHEQYAQFVQPIYVNGVVDTAYVQNGVAFVVVDGQTLQFTFDPPDYPIIIHDDNGVSYTIYPDGTVAVGSYFVISQDQLQTDAAGAAHFQQHPDELFGFDPKEHNQWHDNYEIILLQDQSHYFVSNKSLAVGQGDVVSVFVPSSTPNPSAKLPNGSSLSLVAGSGNGIYTLTIPQFYSKGTYALYIHDGFDRIGKLNIYVYEEKNKEVYLVPIANLGNDPSADIQKIFKEANINLNITVLDAWQNDDFTPSTTIAMPENVGNLDKYSEDMRALRDAYFAAHPNLPKNAYYLFVVAGFNNPNEQGYMVRGKGLGFIKVNSPPRTFAHELAHGIGALPHTWNNNGPAQGTTNNLMDYPPVGPSNQSAGMPNGNLTKAQWQAMRSWSLLPSFWDEEEDGMYSLPVLDYICKPSEIVFSTGEVFKDLDGNFMSLLEGYQPMAFVGAQSLQAGSVSMLRRIYQGTDSVFYPISLPNSSGYYYWDPALNGVNINKKASVVMMPNYSGNVTTISYNNQLTAYEAIQNGSQITLPANLSTTKCGCGIPMSQTSQELYGCLINNGGGYFDPNTPVTHIDISESLLVSSSGSRVLLNGAAIKLGNLSSVYADNFLRKFGHNLKDYIGIYTTEQNIFVGYVNQYVYDTLVSHYAPESLRYYQIPSNAFINNSVFETTPIGDLVYYNYHAAEGCKFIFGFEHDGRLKYEYAVDDQRFVDTEVIYNNGANCPNSFYLSTICSGLDVGAQGIGQILHAILPTSQIPETYYNAALPDYSPVIYDFWVSIDGGMPWMSSTSENKHMVAFICGMYNGLVSNAEGIAELPQMIVQLACSPQFRAEFITAISALMNIDFIFSKIEQDFQGNVYQKAHAAGKYAVEVLFVLIPASKVSWAAKAQHLVQSIKNVPKNIIKFMDDWNALLNQGIQVLRRQTTELVFTTSLNVEILLARFTDDGLMIIESNRYLDNIPPTHQIIYDFGVTTFKLTDNAAPQTKNLLIVRNGDDVKMVGASGAGSTLYSKSYIASLNGFSDNISAILTQRGLSLEEFKLLQQKRYDPLFMTPTEMAHIDAIRNSIPMPDGTTILQKVIPKNQIQNYIDLPNDNFRKVGGFVSTAQDAKHLITFEDIYYGMRLDYISNGLQPFHLTDGSCGVIRFKTTNPNLTVAKLPDVTGDLPYTGNGFTGGNNGKLGVPEWKSPYITPNEGAELWEVFSDGTEVLRATFSTSQNKFIPVP
jgi:hypothetical protein